MANAINVVSLFLLVFALWLSIRTSTLQRELKEATDIEREKRRADDANKKDAAGILLAGLNHEQIDQLVAALQGTRSENKNIDEVNKEQRPPNVSLRRVK